LTKSALIATFILAFIAIAVAVSIVRLYNRLVMLKHSIEKAYANIDVLLQQRADEVPNLVAIVAGHRDHEAETLK
jgi:LemA protein